jgi:hypothetical protein
MKKTIVLLMTVWMLISSAQAAEKHIPSGLLEAFIRVSPGKPPTKVLFLVDGPYLVWVSPRGELLWEKYGDRT